MKRVRMVALMMVAILAAPGCLGTGSSTRAGSSSGTAASESSDGTSKAGKRPTTTTRAPLSETAKVDHWIGTRGRESLQAFVTTVGNVHQKLIILSNDTTSDLAFQDVKAGVNFSGVAATRLRLLVESRGNPPAGYKVDAEEFKKDLSDYEAFAGKVGECIEVYLCITELSGGGQIIQRFNAVLRTPLWLKVVGR